jgi:site-specific DNA-methyltransferase (adenine-specific)
MDKLIADGVKVDAVITDPPYGTTACKWDSVIPFDAMWERLNKLIKPNGAIVLFGLEPFSSHLRISNIKNFRYDIIWDKVKPSNFQMMNYQVGRVHEIISIFSQKPAVFCKGNNMCYYPQKIKRDTIKKVSKTFYGSKNSTLRNGHTIKDLGEKTYTEKHPTSIYRESNANIKSKKHPTQKPVPLMEYLAKTYTNEGETILDFTMGSGSTGVACVNTNRNFIGIELDDKYFEIAKERIYA